MRILGITLSDSKRLEIALTDVYGIGRPRAQAILTEAGIDFGKKPAELTTDEESKIRSIVEKIKLEGDLRREISSNIKRLKDIGAHRGTRHARRLPARGQRTKTNARTLRGARKTMGSGRKVESKT